MCHERSKIIYELVILSLEVVEWVQTFKPPFFGLGLDNHQDFIWSQISEMALWD